MSSFNRRFIVLGLPAGLAACGFAPAYAPGGGGSNLQGAVLVEAPNSRPGYLLTRHIEERLGRGERQVYGLGYSITLTEEAVAISRSNVNTRYNLLGNVTYALRDLRSNAVVLSGQADSFTSYSASGTTVATQAAKRDAEARLMVILGDQILNRLTAEAGKLSA
ncbi:LPS assembly lipoprotein LptE [Roseovarius sp.]|uniref:LPS assembly lipoprotein LptE n=1 Tax=Roseovarius sp. TaxID=1486281 RepID=UPI003D0A2CFF